MSLTNRNTIKAMSAVLALFLVSSALSSVAIAQSGDRADRSKMQQVENAVASLAEKAHRLMAKAQEQANRAAVKEIETALRFVEDAKNAVEENEMEKARKASQQAADHLARAERMLSSETGDINNSLVLKAKRLIEYTERLKSVATEYGNQEVLKILSDIMHLIHEAIKQAENGNNREAYSMLNRASGMLGEASAMLSQTTNASTSVSVSSDSSLAKMIVKLEANAREAVSLAEEQNNRQAFAEATLALELTIEAESLLNEDQIDEAKMKLREASGHLQRAMRLLQQDTSAEIRVDAEVDVGSKDVTIADVNDVYRLKFVVEGSGYGAIKNKNAGAGALVGSDITMEGVASPADRQGIGFVLNEVVLTAYAVNQDSNSEFITLKSTEQWNGKARSNGSVFVTRGTLADGGGNTYIAYLRGNLLEATNQGLVYKITGELEQDSSATSNSDITRLIVNLHYLAVARAAA